MSMNTQRQDEIVQVEAGTLIVRENELSRKMYVIRKGKVRVFKNYLNQRVTLAILGEGEIFGELSFFDAEPRTASVEALTDTELLVIDGNRASQQISSLPDWVIPIFKSVFHRFRLADAKLTVLQSMNEFQKKNFKSDTIAQTIYLELLRLIKTMEILYQGEVQKSGSVTSAFLLKELDDVSGRRFIGLKVFWRLLAEHDFIDHQLERKSGLVSFRQDLLEDWKKYLTSEVESERFLLLKHSAIALMRRIISLLKVEGKQDAKSPVEVTFKEIRLETLPLYEEAVKELAEKEIVGLEKSGLMVIPVDMIKLFTYQSIIKSFDHTIVNLD